LGSFVHPCLAAEVLFLLDEAAQLTGLGKLEVAYALDLAQLPAVFVYDRLFC